MERRHRSRQKISLLIEVEGRLSVLVVEKAMGVGDGLKRHTKARLHETRIGQHHHPKLF